MQKDKFDAIKNNVQEIIDFIAEKNVREATNKLVEVGKELDEILDFSADDEDLMEISRYQVLINQLHQKIVGLNGHANGNI